MISRWEFALLFQVSHHPLDILDYRSQAGFLLIHFGGDKDGRLLILPPLLVRRALRFQASQAFQGHGPIRSLKNGTRLGYFGRHLSRRLRQENQLIENTLRMEPSRSETNRIGITNPNARDALG